MLAMCRRDQWKLTDLDWSKAPRALSRDDEEAIVQYFTDMAQIELLAGELFKEQKRRATDPRLREIFGTFVADEARHSAVATRLAAHYDVHKYRVYRPSESLARFFPHFVRAVTYLSDEIANAYITGGELVLDVALLRSINDFVADEMSEAAMELINRDESRHIAIDFHMTEHYCSDEHLAEVQKRPRPTLREALRMTREITTMMWYAKPFLQQVFLAPMDRTDPSGKRIHEAFKRIQLVLRKPTVARTPFSRFMIKAQELYNHPVIGKVLGRVLLRALGAEDRAARILFTQEELARTQQMSFDELAEEALAVKYGN